MRGQGTIAQIKEQINQPDVSEDWIKQLRQDDRAGVQKLIKQYDKRLEAKQLQLSQFEQMKQYEYNQQAEGYRAIAGVDEVGRGPLAGPVVAASVILDINDQSLLGINDSKKLTEEKRAEYFEIIQKQAYSIGVGIVDNRVIDQINIYEASKRAMRLAIENMNLEADFLLLDAMTLPDLKVPQQSIIKGDAKSISIAAASIVAKVTRDRMMKDFSKKYPAFQFGQNMGYGTKPHLEALQQYGPTPYHRKSFNPVSLYTI
ncbi:ribonuclease HII [Alkalibacillus aidingensis]|uniref:ribonuclease HII n=1 Tax=Alkalibacillus aidingensis TaxID=2747607 RepID=UPI001661021A|nr:ribonuclease HII [Alkalibacillus aidingensis]